MMPPAYITRQQSASEKLFFGTIKSLKFPSNKFRVWRSSFFHMPTAGELERMLANRGARLSQKIGSPKSLRKAADCFSQAAELCDITPIKDYYKKTAGALLEMANNPSHIK